MSNTFEVTTPDNRVLEVTAPEGATEQQVLEFAAQNYEPIEPDTESGDFTSGVKAGTASLMNLVGRAGKSQLQSILGQEEASEESYQDFLKVSRDIAQKYPKEVQSFSEAFESPQNFIDFTQRGVGEGLFSLAAPLATTLITGAVTKNPLTAITSGFGTSALMNVPESYVNLKEAEDVEDPAVSSIPVGFLKSGLDVVTPGRVMGKVFGEGGQYLLANKLLSKAGLKEASKIAGKEASKSFKTEAITEGLQESADIAAEEILGEIPEDVLTPENLERIAQAGYFGGLLGGGVGGVTGSYQAVTAPRVGKDGLSLEEEVLESPATTLPGFKKASTQGSPRLDFNQAVEAATQAVVDPKVDFSQVNRQVLEPQSKTFNEFNESVKFQKLTQPVDGLKLRMTNDIEKRLPKKGTGRMYQDTIKSWENKGRFGKGELEFSGLMEFLESQPGQVDKESVVDYLLSGTPQLKSVLRDEDSVRFPDMTLDPDRTSVENYREFVVKAPFDKYKPQQAFIDPHFYEPNTLVSLRTTDKVIDDKNTLFVEEVQSDLHQQGRKFGYMSKEEYGLRTGQETRVPDLPFKESWEKLGIKKSIQLAANEGKEQLAFPLGDTAAYIQGHPDKSTIGKFYDTNLPGKLKKVTNELGLPSPEIKKVKVERPLPSLNNKGWETFQEKHPELGIEELSEIIDLGLNVNFRPDLIRQGLPAMGYSSSVTEDYINNAISKAVQEFEVITVPLDGEARTRIRNNNIPLFQHLQNHMEKDVLPSQTYTKIAKELKAAELLPSQKIKYQDKIDEIRQAAKKILGDQADLNFVDALIPENTTSAEYVIRGAQFNHSVFVGLGVNDRAGTSSFETALHEFWHFLERTNAFTKEERAALDKHFDKMVDVMLEDSANTIDPLQVQELRKTEEGKEELRATAFGLWANNHLTQTNKNKKLHRRLPPSMDRAMKKGIESLQKLTEAVKRILGWQSPQDVFKNVTDGSKALNNVIAENRILNLQKLYSHTIGLKSAYDASYRIFDDNKSIREAIEESVNEQNTMEGLSKMASYISSPRNLALGGNPIMAEAYSINEARSNRTNERLSDYRTTLKDLENLSKDDRAKVYQLTDRLANGKIKSKLDDEGHLVFPWQGKMRRIKDKNLSRIYSDLQKGFGKVIRDWEGNYRRTIAQELGLESPDFTSTDLESIRTEENTARITEVINKLDDFERMKSQDYAPHIRYGQWGIVIKDLEEKDSDGKPKTVAYYQFESGGYKKKYQKQQLEEAYEDAKRRISKDPKRYVAYGKGGQKLSINSLESFANPFLANSNEKKANVPDKLEGMETLFGLIQSKGVETDVLEQFYNQFIGTGQAERAERGFAKRFTRSENIPGYSQDWDRVHSTYFHGAAHYLAKMEYAPQEALLKASLADLEDSRMKDHVEKYLDYVGSPVEDMQTLRGINFMWALGFNASSAMLQFFTLPTMTLAAQTRLNAHPLQNSARILKWTKLSRHFIQEAEFQDGSVVVNFDDPKAWEKVQKESKLTDEQTEQLRKFVRRQDVRNTIGGLLVEEYAGKSVFETRDKAGKARKVVSQASQLGGAMISSAEQFTRFNSFLSTLELLVTDPAALQKGLDLYGNTPLYKKQKQQNPDMEDSELLALNIMDDAHAVFGKGGRPSYMKGLGGSLVFPFMTHVHYMLEFMKRMATKQGTAGKIGFATAVGSFMFFSGLIGLPGGELLKELYEELHKLLAEEEIDIDYVIRDKITDFTGDPNVGLLVTQGFPRAYLGQDVARRIGVSVPGQDLLLSLIGARGDSTDMLGVPGSILSGVGRAFQEYNVEEAPTLGAMKEMMPVAISNIMKAIEYNNKGVSTGKGAPLLTADEVTPAMVAQKALGINSGKIATMRELAYYTQVIGREHKPAYENFREKAKRTYTKYQKAMNEDEFKEASKYYEEYQGILDDLLQWQEENNYDISLTSFTDSVVKAANQRLDPVLYPEDVRGPARYRLDDIKRTLGVEDIR